MPYYHVCVFCGAHLDPGEQCDCMKNNVTSNVTVTQKLNLRKEMIHDDKRRCSKKPVKYIR